MIRLFIIADDLTGTLDTGVQFAAHHACTRVITDPSADLSLVAPEVEVLVMDAETRHLSAQDAYRVVYRAVRQATELGIPYIYKKTDSALRGNIGAELTAMLHASGRARLPFLPAFPQIGRSTRDGVHYIDGVPVAKSVFGNDPFEPVIRSGVAELIALESDVTTECRSAPRCADDLSASEGIVVYDASSEEELVRAGRLLFDAGDLHIMAGCAGFGAVVPELLGLSSSVPSHLPSLDPRLLVICGSVNAITLAQLRTAQENGFERIHLTPAEKLTPDYFSHEEGQRRIADLKQRLSVSSAFIIDANDDGGNDATAAYAKEHGLSRETVRQRISGTLGRITRDLFACPDLGTLFITGGDTLLQCMKHIGVYDMEPIGELDAGVVLSRFTVSGHARYVISKSGGFGHETLLVDLLHLIRSDEKARVSAD